MSTVSIFSVPTSDGPPTFCAVAGASHSRGATAGEALDALSAQLAPGNTTTVVIVQQMRPDELFNETQQRRLGELMSQWRAARDQGATLPDADSAELQSLIDAEFRAAGERAAHVASERGA